jgi:hypothetical protein
LMSMQFVYVVVCSYYHRIIVGWVVLVAVVFLLCSIIP